VQLFFAYKHQLLPKKEDNRAIGPQNLKKLREMKFLVLCYDKLQSSFPPEKFSWLRPWHLLLTCVRAGRDQNKNYRVCRKQILQPPYKNIIDTTAITVIVMRSTKTNSPSDLVRL